MPSCPVHRSSTRNPAPCISCTCRSVWYSIFRSIYFLVALNLTFFWIILCNFPLVFLYTTWAFSTWSYLSVVLLLLLHTAVVPDLIFRVSSTIKLWRLIGVHVPASYIITNQPPLHCLYVSNIIQGHLGLSPRIKRRSGEWRTVQHVCVASQNRQLITSSTAAHYIDHHPKLASLKLDHWAEKNMATTNWVDNMI